jgi:hypothetical protein
VRVAGPGALRAHQHAGSRQRRAEIAIAGGARARLGVQLEDRQVAPVEDRERHALGARGRRQHVLRLAVVEPALAQPVAGDPRLAGQVAVDELAFAHLQRGDDDRAALVESDVLGDVERQAGLADARPGGQHDEVAGLQSADRGVEPVEAGGQADDSAVAAPGLLEAVNLAGDRVEQAHGAVPARAAPQREDPCSAASATFSALSARLAIAAWISCVAHPRGVRRRSPRCGRRVRGLRERPRANLADDRFISLSASTTKCDQQLRERFSPRFPACVGSVPVELPKPLPCAVRASVRQAMRPGGLAMVPLTNDKVHALLRFLGFSLQLRAAAPGWTARSSTISPPPCTRLLAAKFMAAFGARVRAVP